MEKVHLEKYYVLYLDLLGISALTQLTEENERSIPSECYEIWLKRYKNDEIKQTKHYLAAAVLSTFRKILKTVSNEYKKIQVTQVSDGAFVWSTDGNEIILYARKIMSQFLEEGLLCRGGLSYGEAIFIRTAMNSKTLKIEAIEAESKIGRFIIGEAVTKAVKQESEKGKGKGAVVMVDNIVIEKLSLTNEFINVEENCILKYDVNIDYLRSKKFGWNKITDEGRSKVASTKELLSQF